MLHTQTPEAHRQLEPSRTRASRIEVEHAVPQFLLGDMAVTADNDREPAGLWIEVQPGQIVEHVDENAAGVGDFSFRQLACPRGLVDIAAHHGQRGDLCKFLKNLGRTNVPGVNDSLASPQRLERLGTQQTVRVGDDADEDGGLSSQFSVRYRPFIFSTNFPKLTTARPTVPRPISWTSSFAVTRRV